MEFPLQSVNRRQPELVLKTFTNVYLCFAKLSVELIYQLCGPYEAFRPLALTRPAREAHLGLVGLAALWRSTIHDMLDEPDDCPDQEDRVYFSRRGDNHGLWVIDL